MSVSPESLDQHGKSGLFSLTCFLFLCFFPLSSSPLFFCPRVLFDPFHAVIPFFCPPFFLVVLCPPSLSPLLLLPLFCLSVSPEVLRLWASGDHEEATGETCREHLWLGGGVFWRRQRSLTPSLFLTSCLLSSTGSVLFALRLQQTTPSLWRSCVADRKSSVRRHRLNLPGKCFDH